jgi:mannosyltransferase
MRKETLPPREGISAKASLVIVATLTILAAVLRFYRLDNGLWFDEIATLVKSVRLPLAQIVTGYRGDNDHTLYSLLAHFSIQLLGEHGWSLRLPAALLGVASVPLLFLVAKGMTSRGEAIMATAILTVSYHHVWFSQNARGYTGLLVCTLLSTHFLLQWFQRDSKSSLVGYSVATALGAYFQLSMIVVAASHGLVAAHRYFRPGKHDFRKLDLKDLILPFAGSGALTLLLYAPMLQDMFRSMTSKGITTGVDFATPLWAIESALRGLQIGLGSLWIIAAGLIVFSAGITSYFKQNSSVALMLLLPGVVVLSVALALGHTTRPRFFFFCIGFGLLIIVRGASVLGSIAAQYAGRLLTPEKAATFAAASATALAILVSVRSLPYAYHYPKQGYVQAGEFVERTRVASDEVAAVSDSVALPMLDYFGKPWSRIDHLPQLEELQRAGKPVWVVYTFPEYIEQNEPALWNVLKHDCKNAAEFHGTLDGGGITVKRCESQPNQLN